MEHATFYYLRVTAHRTELEVVAKRRLTLENILEFMLETKKVWNQMEKMLQTNHEQDQKSSGENKKGVKPQWATVKN